MDDGLDIPEFLRRESPTPEELEKLRRKWRREDHERRPVMPAADYKVNRDRQGRPLPRSMDATSWALLAEIEKAERVKEAEKQAASNEFFRVKAAERAEIRAVKKAAKEANKC